MAKLSPTSRSLRLLREEGFIVQVVENDRVAIRLTKGLKTIIDEEDIWVLEGNKWFTLSSGSRSYAARSAGQRGKQELLHRLITDCPPNKQVDHINGNTLDNRKANLRICTQKENVRNSKKKNGSSKYKGVTYDSRSSQENRNDRWHAQITVDGRHIFLGSFKTEREAARAYDKAAKEHFKQFARINYA